MTKILRTLILGCAAFSLFCGVQVWACATDNQSSVTGSACSIRELTDLENKKHEQGMFSSEPKGVQMNRDLRPVNLNSDRDGIKSINEDCLFGMCLKKKLLGY